VIYGSHLVKGRDFQCTTYNRLTPHPIWSTLGWPVHADFVTSRFLASTARFSLLQALAVHSFGIWGSKTGARSSCDMRVYGTIKTGV
jgi:hypothetical protein